MLRTFKILFSIIVICTHSPSNLHGRIVYQSNNPEQGWDGNYQNYPSQTGLYYYFLKYSTKNQHFDKKGPLILLR